MDSFALTRGDIIRLAREAGIDAENDTLCRYEGWVEPLTHFAFLAVAAEARGLQKQRDDALALVEWAATALPDVGAREECLAMVRKMRG